MRKPLLETKDYVLVVQTLRYVVVAVFLVNQREKYSQK